MATARKRFFTVECSLYREPWPRELKLALVMLGMHMTDRWAADCLTAKQATIAHLALGDLLTITGAETRDEAHEVLRKLASLVSLRVTLLDNGFARVEWRKLAETQWSKSRYSGSKPGNVRATLSPKKAPSDSDPDPDPDSDSEEAEKEKKKMTPARAGRTVKPVGKSAAPEMLDPAQTAVLREWVGRGADERGLGRPDLESKLTAIVEGCLDHHRAKGSRHVDWVATCRTWFRNQVSGKFGREHVGEAMNAVDCAAFHRREAFYAAKEIADAAEEAARATRPPDVIETERTRNEASVAALMARSHHIGGPQ